MKTENNAETVSARRALLAKGGAVAGAVLTSGLTTRTAQAADPNASNNATSPMMTMPAGEMRSGLLNGNTTGMMADARATNRAMSAAMLTKRDAAGIPQTGVIRTTTQPGAAEQNDAAILNFALALEYLEAEFYNLVVQADNNRPFLQGRVKDLARILARDEGTHVAAVSDAVRRLGGTPINKPTFVFPSNVFVSPLGFLMISSQLEETGVHAYLGQGGNVRRKDVLNFAASIYGNETRHAALIRLYLGDPLAPRDMELPFTMAQIAERVRPFFADPAQASSIVVDLPAPR